MWLKFWYRTQVREEVRLSQGLAVLELNVMEAGTKKRRKQRQERTFKAKDVSLLDILMMVSEQCSDSGV